MALSSSLAKIIPGQLWFSKRNNKTEWLSQQHIFGLRTQSSDVWCRLSMQVHHITAGYASTTVITTTTLCTAFDVTQSPSTPMRHTTRTQPRISTRQLKQKQTLRWMILSEYFQRSKIIYMYEFWLWKERRRERRASELRTPGRRQCQSFWLHSIQTWSLWLQWLRLCLGRFPQSPVYWNISGQSFCRDRSTGERGAHSFLHSLWMPADTPMSCVLKRNRPAMTKPVTTGKRMSQRRRSGFMCT